MLSFVVAAVLVSQGLASQGTDSARMATNATESSTGVEDLESVHIIKIKRVMLVWYDVFRIDSFVLWLRGVEREFKA